MPVEAASGVKEDGAGCRAANASSKLPPPTSDGADLTDRSWPLWGAGTAKDFGAIALGGSKPPRPPEDGRLWDKRPLTSPEEGRLSLLRPTPSVEKALAAEAESGHLRGLPVPIAWPTRPSEAALLRASHASRSSATAGARLGDTPSAANGSGARGGRLGVPALGICWTFLCPS